MLSISASVLLAALAAAPAAVSSPSSMNPVARVRERFPDATVVARSDRAVSMITGLHRALPAGHWAEGATQLVLELQDVLDVDATRSRVALDRTVRGGSLTAFRFRQEHLGLPVLDRDLVVAVNARGEVHSLSNGLERIGEVDTRFTLPAAAAVRAAVAKINPRSWSGQPRRTERVITRVGGAWRAVWVVEIPSLDPVGSWRVLVDANAPRVLSVSNLIRTVQGYAFSDTPENGGYTAVTLEDLESTDTLTGKYVDAYSNCVPDPQYGAPCTDSKRQARVDANGNFMSTPNEGSANDPFAEVQTYYTLTRMHSFFVGFGFEGLDSPMPVAANFTLDRGLACNAAFMGTGIVIGMCRWAGVNFAYDAGVIMHEYTHAAVEFSAGLVMPQIDEWGFLAMPTALNEGYADFFPATVIGDSKIGRHVAPALYQGQFLRDLEAFHSCPEDLEGESHNDGQIWSSANWEAFAATNRSPELVTTVFEGLLTLSSTATFDDAAQASLAAADAHDPSIRTALQNAYERHGVIGCGRFLAIEPGKTVRGKMINPYDAGINASSMPAQQQYRVTVPAKTAKLVVTMKATRADGSSAKGLVTLYANPGDQVFYAEDAVEAETSTEETSLTFKGKELVEGDWYLLPVGTGFWGSGSVYSYAITATVVPEDPTPPANQDGSSDVATAHVPQSCSCGAASGGEVAAPTALLLLGVLALGMRRRRADALARGR